MNYSNRLIDIFELQKIFPCSRSHIYNMVKAGEIPSVACGRRKFVPGWYLDKILEDPNSMAK